MRRMVYSGRTRPIALSTVIAFVVQLLALPVYADEPATMRAQATTRATVENTQIAIRGGIVTITYDLVASEVQRALDVSLEVSTDGGQTFDLQPRSMSGDVGRAVPPGRGKQIVWESGKDVENLQTSQFRFRVVITVEQGPASPTGPGVQPAPPPVSAQVPQGSGGNRMFWPGLGLFAAGGALAGLAAAGTLRKKTEFVGFYELAPNKPIMYGGIGVAATGLLLLLLGRRGGGNSASVAPIPAGVMLYRTTRF